MNFKYFKNKSIYPKKLLILKMVINMLIRLGYVAISKTLDNITTSSTITLTNFQKDPNYDKISKIIVSNLEALIKLLEFNRKNNIHFYRMTSNLIPLATLKEITFDYLKSYQPYYQKIGHIINKNNMRVDMHPSQYCILNSTKKEVVETSIDILKYHYNLLKAMDIKTKVIILHIGSSTFGKEKSLSRFINNFRKLPKYLQTCIAIENDDKVFNIEDCLKASKILNIPVVLDYHHHLCNKTEKGIEEYLSRIFATWIGIKPKIHFSSPKNKKDFRSHHDYIDSDKFIEFLIILKKFEQDVDIMIEAKAKDEAMFKLIRELKYKTNYNFIDETSFEI